MASDKVGIVIPVLNQFQLAVEAIESIYYPWEYRVYPILNYRENLSLAGAWNKGAYKAFEDGCTHVLIINDDVLFSPLTILEIKLALDMYSDVLLCSGVNLRGSMEPHEIYTWTAHSKGLLFDCEVADNPDFACFMITQQTFDIVGTFDEKFSPAYFEDNDYHRRITLAGYRGVCALGAGYYHYGSKTQNADKDVPTVPPFLFEINRAYYINKWGGIPMCETFTQPFDNPELTWRDW